MLKAKRIGYRLWPPFFGIFNDVAILGLLSPAFTGKHPKEFCNSDILLNKLREFESEYKEVYYICFFTWHADQSLIDTIKSKSDFDLNKTIFCANDDSDANLCKSNNLNYFKCSKASFLTNQNFYPMPFTEKKYDAIYNAGICSFKRHYLAKDIENLSLVYYKRNLDYYNEVRSVLRHADWINEKDGPYRRLEPKEVCLEINKAKVGLALSEVEGVCFASCEYLHSGIPIVSTPALGPRTSYYNDKFTRIVDPDPLVIKEAVEEMSRRKLDPYEISSWILDFMRPQKKTFYSKIQELTGYKGEINRYSFRNLLLARPQHPV